MNISPDNFIQESKRINEARKAIIAIVKKVEQQYGDSPSYDGELQLELALNGYSLIPYSSGLSPKPEWVVISSPTGMFEPSYVVSADPTKL